jgi:4a-hydroxytetrahydrobiopterin dehydratase
MSHPPKVSELLKKHCAPPAPGAEPMSVADVRAVLAELPGWELVDTEIFKTYPFANYHETMAFVNATAWISHREDHHPDLEVGYNKCRVRYSTHSIGGLSENDLICAAKVEALVGGGAAVG